MSSTPRARAPLVAYARTAATCLPTDERGFDLVLGALELLLGHRLRLDQLDLRQQRPLECLRLLARQGRGVEPEEVGIHRAECVIAAGIERHPLLVH